MKLDFRERLKRGPILCDGAMGTLLDLYGQTGRPHEIQNINNPDIVERVHHEYIEAGAEIIETNTFSGNRFRLAQYHLQDRLREINRTAVEIAVSCGRGRHLRCRIGRADGKTARANRKDQTVSGS